ncbi:MAG: SWIM zinc finger family protein [Propionibacteriaceae bacterium]
MAVWERDRVLALSPDPASTAAARRLAAPAHWSSTGSTARALWGLCQGSGQRPYQTVVDLGAEPAYACTCPSRKFPCKHALALLMLWTAGGVPTVETETGFAADWLRGRQQRAKPPAAKTDGPLADPEAAARRVAARAERVSSGLDDLERWLRDQVQGGLAGVERAGYAHFDRVAARMVDAQAPGVASMLRAIPAELAADGWPARVLERLAALHVLIQAHRRLDALPAELAANVRSRVGYPVTKAEVLASAGVRDHWIALGSVDTIEYQLETRRVWLYGTRTGRWALWLAFAAPGMSLDTSVLPGQLLNADLHFYPGSGFRAMVGEQHDADDGITALPSETFGQVGERLAALLASDPWASRLPAIVNATPVPPVTASGTWRLRDELGQCVEVVGLPGDPWVLLARSGGRPTAIFGEWSDAGFRPLSLLPDALGTAFTTALVA